MACSKNKPRKNNIKSFYCNPFNKRPSGRPKKKWKNCVDEEFAILKVKSSKPITGRKTEWENLLRKA